MKKIFKAVCLSLTLPFALSAGACKILPPGEPQKQLAQESDWITTTTWNSDMLEAYTKPYWYSREIYNETGIFVGEEGTFELMYTPTEIQSVRSYDLQTTYVEGVDYEIVGKKIKRIATGSIPYWAVNEYYCDVKTGEYELGLNRMRIEPEYKDMVPKAYYLPYCIDGATNKMTARQVAVTYRHADIYSGKYPTGQTEKFANLLSKIKAGKDINILVTGDSVGEGCSASGTVFGGNIRPYMPDAWNIVKEWISAKYNVNVTVDNIAKGGDTLLQCVAGYDSRLNSKGLSTKDYDLLILRIGGNDQATAREDFEADLATLLDKFFIGNPDSNVVMVCPERANTQAIEMWQGNVPYLEYFFQTILDTYVFKENVGMANVAGISQWMLDNGKKSRDFLTNNINHSNDFMIRSYAQTILKAIFGNEYVNEYI